MTWPVVYGLGLAVFGFNAASHNVAWYDWAAAAGMLLALRFPVKS